METITLQLDQIRLDGDTQARAEIDPQVVEEYKHHYANGVKMPPLVVFFDGADYWLSDGFHRHSGAHDAGQTTILCELHQGSLEDARWHSYAANKTNGLHRSNADKQRAVRRALAHPNGANLSDRQIAEHVGVSDRMVAKYRAEMGASTKLSKIDNRTVTRGRTTCQQDTSRIGKNRTSRTGRKRSVAEHQETSPLASDEATQAPQGAQTLEIPEPAAVAKVPDDACLGSAQNEQPARQELEPEGDQHAGCNNRPHPDYLPPLPEDPSEAQVLAAARWVAQRKEACFFNKCRTLWDEGDLTGRAAFRAYILDAMDPTPARRIQLADDPTPEEVREVATWLAAKDRRPARAKFDDVWLAADPLGKLSIRSTILEDPPLRFTQGDTRMDHPCPICRGSGILVIEQQIPESLDSPEFLDAWAEWLAYRRQKRQNLTDLTAKRQLKVLTGLGITEAVKAIHQSITHGWTGLFAPKDHDGGTNGRARLKLTAGDVYDPDAKKKNPNHGVW